MKQKYVTKILQIEEQLEDVKVTTSAEIEIVLNQLRELVANIEEEIGRDSLRKLERKVSR